MDTSRTACRLTSVIIALVTALAGARSASQTNPSSEYQVKAAFLYHFAQFVDWPEGTFREADSPMVYCTIGEDPFHGSLDTALSGKTIGTHPLRVRHAKEAQDAQDCQVVFIGEGEKKPLAAVLAMLKDHPVLLVGESEHFAQEGGTIGFCLEESKVRFEINLEAAEKARLKISSKLLSLAKNVIGEPRGI